MTMIARTMIFTSLVLSAAIFGFFYAWVCSTMWGLDAANPRVAMEAMQAMNASVRNAVFFPAFFLTPVAAVGTAILLWREGLQRGALWIGAGGLVYAVLGMGLTMAINVPMNEALGRTPVPDEVEKAREIWQAYSGRWQIWNITRTITSGVAFVMIAWGAMVASR